MMLFGTGGLLIVNFTVAYCSATHLILDNNRNLPRFLDGWSTQLKIR
jgi:hypothetical protein